MKRMHSHICSYFWCNFFF